MVTITKRTKKALMAAFKNFTSCEFPDMDIYGLMAGKKMFPVWDDHADRELSDLFGIVSSGNEPYRIGNSFIVWFDWSIQKWRVG